MQRSILVGVVAAVVLSFSMDAKAFGIGADFGYSRILVEDGKDSSGYGGDLYVRPLPLPIIDPELQFGLHHFSDDNANQTIWPIMAGARLDLPFVPLFVAGHVGVLGSHYSVSGSSALQTPTFSDTNWDFGFNVGGGFHFLELPLIKLGVSALYYIVPKNHDDGTPDFNMFTIGLDAALGF